MTFQGRSESSARSEAKTDTLRYNRSLFWSTKELSHIREYSRTREFNNVSVTYFCSHFRGAPRSPVQNPMQLRPIRLFLVSCAPSLPPSPVKTLSPAGFLIKHCVFWGPACWTTSCSKGRTSLGKRARIGCKTGDQTSCDRRRCFTGRTYRTTGR